MKSILIWIFGWLCIVSISQCYAIPQEGSKLSLLNALKVLHDTAHQEENEFEGKRGGPLSNFNRHRQRKGKRNDWEEDQSDHMELSKDLYEKGQIELVEKLGKTIDTSSKRSGNVYDYLNFGSIKSPPRKKGEGDKSFKRESEDDDFDFDIFKSDPRKKDQEQKTVLKQEVRMQEVNDYPIQQSRDIEDEIKEVFDMERHQGQEQSFKEEYDSNDLAKNIYNDIVNADSRKQDEGEYDKNSFNNNYGLSEEIKLYLLEKASKIQQMMMYQQEGKEGKRGHPLANFSRHRQTRRDKKDEETNDKPEAQLDFDQLLELLYIMESSAVKLDSNKVLEGNSQKRTSGGGDEDFGFDWFGAASNPRKKWLRVYKQEPRK